MERRRRRIANDVVRLRHPSRDRCPCPVTGTDFVVAERDRDGDEAVGLVGLVAHREVQVKTVEARAGVARKADLLAQLDDVALVDA